MLPLWVTTQFKRDFFEVVQPRTEDGCALTAEQLHDSEQFTKYKPEYGRGGDTREKDVSHDPYLKTHSLPINSIRQQPSPQ